MEDKKSDMIEDKSSHKKAPSSITVNVKPRMAFDETKNQGTREIPKSLLAVLIALGSLLAVGVIVLGVLLITQPQTAAAVDITPSATQTAEPTATQTAKPTATQTAEPTATPEPTKTPTPIQTTAPEESDDFSSIFEAPTNPILDDESGN